MSNVVRTSTRVRRPASPIRRVASIPSIRGIRTSISTTSGSALGPGHVAWQVLEGWLALAVFSLAVRALIRTRRRPAAAAGA
jgi:hypothetical protein